MKPGIHDLSNEAYHSGQGLSSSSIKELLKSPAHYHARVLRGQEEPTPEMLRGTLVHALILEPEKFENEFAVGDFKIRRGKEYDRLCEDNPGKKIISLDEVTEARKVVNAFHEQAEENPELKALVEHGTKEMSFFWEDPRTGILCKCRPDNLPGFGVCTDIKTARDASFDSFQKAIVDFGYFISGAFYLRGLKEVAKSESVLQVIKEIPNHFAMVVIETKEPYATAIYRLDEKAISIGDQLVDVALDRYSEAIATESWQGYSKKCLDIGLPQWAIYKMNSVYAIK